MLPPIQNSTSDNSSSPIPTRRSFQSACTIKSMALSDGYEGRVGAGNPVAFQIEKGKFVIDSPKQLTKRTGGQIAKVFRASRIEQMPEARDSPDSSPFGTVRLSPTAVAKRVHTIRSSVYFPPIHPPWKY